MVGAEPTGGRPMRFFPISEIVDFFMTFKKASGSEGCNSPRPSHRPQCLTDHLHCTSLASPLASGLETHPMHLRSPSVPALLFSRRSASRPFSTRVLIASETLGMSGWWRRQASIFASDSSRAQVIDGFFTLWPSPKWMRNESASSSFLTLIAVTLASMF
jgi:hypothetical protein